MSSDRNKASIQINPNRGNEQIQKKAMCALKLDVSHKISFHMICQTPRTFLAHINGLGAEFQSIPTTPTAISGPHGWPLVAMCPIHTPNMSRMDRWAGLHLFPTPTPMRTSNLHPFLPPSGYDAWPEVAHNRFRWGLVLLFYSSRTWNLHIDSTQWQSSRTASDDSKQCLQL